MKRDILFIVGLALSLGACGTTDTTDDGTDDTETEDTETEDTEAE